MRCLQVNPHSEKLPWLFFYLFAPVRLTSICESHLRFKAYIFPFISSIVSYMQICNDTDTSPNSIIEFQLVIDTGIILIIKIVSFIESLWKNIFIYIG